LPRRQPDAGHTAKLNRNKQRDSAVSSERCAGASRLNHKHLVMAHRSVGHPGETHTAFAEESRVTWVARIRGP
jgi:hypothetical protein